MQDISNKNKIELWCDEYTILAMDIIYEMSFSHFKTTTASFTQTEMVHSINIMHQLFSRSSNTQSNSFTDPKKKITWIFHLWIHAFDFICDIEMNITQMQATTIDTLYNKSIFVVVYFFCYCTAFNPYHAHNLFVDLLFFSLFTHIIHAHTFHKIKQQKRT